MISSPKASVSVPTAHVHSSNMVQNSCEMGVLRCWRALGSDRSCRPTPPHPARGGRSRTNAVCLGGWRALASAPSGCEARALASECGEGRPGWGPRSWALRRLGLQGLSALRRPNAGGRRGCSESHGAADTDVFSADTRAPCGLCPRHPGWGHTAASLCGYSREVASSFLSSWDLCVLGGVSGWIISGCQRSTGMGVPGVGSRLSFRGHVSARVGPCVCSPSPGAAAGRLPPGLSTSVSLALFASIVVSFSCAWVLSYFVLRPLFSCFYIYTERECRRVEEGSGETGSGTRRSARTVPAAGLHPMTRRSGPTRVGRSGMGSARGPCFNLDVCSFLGVLRSVCTADGAVPALPLWTDFRSQPPQGGHGARFGAGAQGLCASLLLSPRKGLVVRVLVFTVWALC